MKYSNIPYIYPIKTALRKYQSIALLLVLLFNVVGYRAWFYYVEMKADLAMETRLDNGQYDENKLIALSVSLDNPYQLEQKSFERVSGEICFEGKIFKYVKRRVFEGKLVVLCIPDDHRMALSNAKSAFGNAVNSLPNNRNTSPHSGFQKNIQGSDYINEWANGKTWQIAHESLEYYVMPLVGFSEPHIATPGKPPQSRA